MSNKRLSSWGSKLVKINKKSLLTEMPDGEMLVFLRKARKCLNLL